VNIEKKDNAQAVENLKRRAIGESITRATGEISTVWFGAANLKNRLIGRVFHTAASVNGPLKTLAQDQFKGRRGTRTARKKTP